MRHARVCLIAAGLFIGAAVFPAGTAGAYTLKTIYSFCAQSQCRDGAAPESRPLIDAQGNLYLTTDLGGAHADGTVVELVHRKDGSWRELVLHSFDGTDGAIPYSAPIRDRLGNLYGTTLSNTAYELIHPKTHPGWSVKVLYRFCSKANCADGTGPRAGLTYQGARAGLPYDGVSPLYGTTANGGSGASLGGVAFRLTLNSGQWSEDVLYNFCSQGGTNCSDGEESIGGLLLDASGNLYGTTQYGGMNGIGGTVFELSPGDPNWTLTTLYSFCHDSGCPDGGQSRSDLLMNDLGAIYSATTGGGIAGSNCAEYFGVSQCGVVFQLVPGNPNYKETVLFTFCLVTKCTDGAMPSSGLVADSAGTLYGTTRYGGTGAPFDGRAGSGTVYSQTGNIHQVLYSFCSQTGCTDGAAPDAEVSVDSSGNIFGTTSVGGEFGQGAVFELSP